MRHEHLAGRVGVLAVFAAGLLVSCGCRQQEPDYAYDKNLGDAPGELMPLAVSPANPRILEDQKGVTAETPGPAKRRVATEAGEEAEEAKPTGRRTRRPGGRTDRPSGPAQDQPPSAEKAAKDGGPTDVTKKAAASPLAARAQQFVQSLAGGKFEEAAKGFGPQMRQAMPVAQLQTVWQGVIAQLGPFKATQPGTEAQEGRLTAVFVPTEFTRGVVRVKVVYDQNGAMAGLWLEPPGGLPTAATAPTVPAGRVPAAESPPTRAPAKPPATKTPPKPAPKKAPAGPATKKPTAETPGKKAGRRPGF